VKRFVLILIRGYQAGLSPLLPGTCRFTPTCSEYAWLAVERFGVGSGSWLALKRLSRCHPLGGHGFDPVPGGEAGGGRKGEIIHDRG
jgi:putative membrane protein insertion efficiency factor